MKFIIIILTLFFLIYLTNSQFPIQEEYNCLKSIAVKYSPSGWSKTENGTYTFCTYIGMICNVDTGRVQRLQISGSGGNINKLNYTDLICMPNFEELEINYLDIDPNLIYYKFPNCKIVKYSSTNGIINGITQALPSYDEFTLYSLKVNNSIVKTSYLCNVGILSIYGSGYVNLVNDDMSSCLNISKLNQLYIWATNYPDFSQFNGLKTLSMGFDSRFDISSTFYFSKIFASNVIINHQINLEITPFYFSRNLNIKTLKISGSFEKPLSIVDLRGNINYESISLTVYGFQFNVYGHLPIIVGNNVTFSFSNGNLTAFPSLQLFGDPSHRVEISRSISISTVLPSFSGVGLSYDLSSNKLSGTIDSSWCNTEVNFYLNTLSGSIPSCFSCYFKSSGSDYLPSMYDRFVGNQFTAQQLNMSMPCTTFLPSVKVINSTTMIVQGIDIGFNSSNWLVNGSIAIKQTIPIKIGSEYNCTISSGSFKGVDYFSVLFVLPNNNLYTFPVNLNKEPNPNYVLLNNSTLKIKGAFFSSYMNYTNQSVTIGSNNFPCIITSGDFFNIECDAQSSISGKSMLIVKTGVTKRRVMTDLQNGLINNKTCPNDCTGDINGVCDLSTGLCMCEIGFVYSDCSGIDCGVYCQNNGICDFSTGNCICSLGYIGVNCNTSTTRCPSNNSLQCSGFGFCDSKTGLCVCNRGYQGYACDIPTLTCPVGSNLQICSGLGSCDYNIGQCMCDIGRALGDCSGYECSPVDCFSRGYCDFTVGNCICFDRQWLGDNCSIPYQYITSISPSTTDGGLAIIYGFFGDIHGGLSIKLDTIDCEIHNYSSSEISFIAPPDTGIKSLSIYQNGITINETYRYENKIKLCQSNCSRNGICNSTNGQCNCNNGFSGFDCSITSGTGSSTNTTIDPSTGGANMTNQQINFNIYFKSIFEIDYNGKKVKEYPLKNNWKINSKPNNNQQYQLTQTIQDKGTCTIISIIEEITNPKEFTFANTTFRLDKGSIKFTISINNYTYQNNLNTLQLQLVSLIDEDNNISYDKDDSDCNKNQTNIETNDNQEGDLNFNYIKISKDNRVLVGRFINKVVSNGRSTFLSTTLTNDTQSAIVSLNLPHCIDCLIDPDFSLIITSDFKPSCDDGDSNSNWVIPTSVIISVVGAAIIAGTLLFYYRKNFIEGKLQKQLNQLKMSKQKTNK
ncbi:hypothetical protein RB653_002380 [Dictyostelium firmibasis]|uniref:EGF-like domain-containing protein n=1 Tax=Dictyostelium firmibasis TaxID=79012 RepID=A0AAN7TQK1_9MYCE